VFNILVPQQHLSTDKGAVYRGYYLDLELKTNYKTRFFPDFNFTIYFYLNWAPCAIISSLKPESLWIILGFQENIDADI
jgi:arginyl-tRNA--protein-N-Asp/Glu arginylyltransferase